MLFVNHWPVLYLLAFGVEWNHRLSQVAYAAFFFVIQRLSCRLLPTLCCAQSCC